MPQVDPIILQLRAETTQLRNELRSTTILVQDQMNQQTRSITRLEATAESSTRRIGSSFAAMGGNIRAALAGFAIGAVVRELASLADQAKQLDAQLRLATSGFGTLAQAQKDVQRISEETRGSLEATTKLYAGFVRASRETGRSQDDAARATQTFAEALKIGGASTEEAASATLQFNQALQSGVLRGDEFNSIMEASPRIARLLADALGVPIGQLRKMAEEGQITSDVLFKALTDRKFTAGIDAEFKQIPITFGDAVQAMENAAVISFGQFDKGGRFSEALVSFLGTGTDTFNGLTSRAEQYGADARAIFDGLGNLFDPIGANGQAVFDALGIRIFSVREQITSLLQSIDNVDNFFRRINNFGVSVDNAFISGLNEAQRRAGGRPEDMARLRQFLPEANRAGRFTSGANASDARSAQRRNEDALAARFGGIQGLNRYLSDPTKYNLFGQSTARPPRPTPPRPGGAGRTRSGRSGKTDAERQQERDDKFTDSLSAAISRDAMDDSSVRPMLLPDSDRVAAAARQFRDIIGEVGKDYDDPFASVKDYDASQDVYYKSREEADQKLQQKREQDTYQLAGLFESALTQSGDQFWESFKRNALRTLAFIAAQAVVTSFSSGGGGFGSLLGNLGRGLTGGGGGSSRGGLLSGLGFLFGAPTGIPGFATGGSMLIGGRSGVDQNLLSLNGQPIARVSRGETLNVNPGSVSPRGSGGQRVFNISVDARNSVTPAGFAQDLSQRILTQAAQMDVDAGRATLRQTPGYVATSQRFGQPKTI
ncbi:tape measure protein [Sphingomonas sp. NPDC019816]|uniref:tape measure protein n=1 Tax=Sphingomonas sp. NPDC019816 TaxID=3390679 RepID=UPI003D08E591